jgi:hypothetical protein
MRFWAALVLVGGSTAWASSGGFGFRVPPGWVNLSPDVPEAERKQAPPLLLEQIARGGHPFFAADLAHADDGFMENVNAVVQPGASSVTQAVLDEFEPGMQAELKKQGLSFRVLEKSLVKVGGVTAGRIESELTMGENVVKQIQYLLPGKGHHAVVTYSTVPEKFDQYRSVFDAAAAATTGVVEPRSLWARIGQRALWGALIGAVLGGLAALASRIKKRRR